MLLNTAVDDWFLWLYSVLLYKYLTSKIHPIADRHLSCFQFQTFAKNAMSRVYVIKYTCGHLYAFLLCIFIQKQNCQIIKYMYVRLCCYSFTLLQAAYENYSYSTCGQHQYCQSLILVMLMGMQQHLMWFYFTFF